MFGFLPTTLQLLLASALWPNAPAPTPPPAAAPLRFQLKHLHGVAHGTRTIFHNVPASLAPETFSLTATPLTAHRPPSPGAFAGARWRSFARGQSESMEWEPVDVRAPNVSSRANLLTLAKMTNNAYADPADKDWYDLGEDWDVGYPFGWEPDADGFRGHVFVSEDNSTVVISIKGTSAGWIVGGSGPTIKKDKLNDNLLFSCCCARVGPTWSTVCGCWSGGYKCDQNCVEKSLIDDSLFYPTGVNLYNNITYMYPDATIWLTGHSLGGSLASLIGVTFGAPTVAFEAVGEKQAAQRLHLPSPPSTQHITHVYHTADPIPMGACTGVTSSCAIAGYALETRCHLGRVLRYDTVTRHGWAVDIRSHGIRAIVERLLNEDWEPPSSDGPGREVPEFGDEEECVDCFSWEYGNFQNASALAAPAGCSSG